MAARRLFENGIMVRDGAAMERLAEIDSVVFDKTGTLTHGHPRLLDAQAHDSEALALAAALAGHSRHPYSRALVAAAAGLGRPVGGIVFSEVSELPGAGLEARAGGVLYRMGKPEWALGADDVPEGIASEARVVLSSDGHALARFSFDDRLRADARQAISALTAAGLEVEILSGDREEPVGRLAAVLGLPHGARVSPGGKLAHVEAAAVAGHKVLMVGDGLNDAPALARAHASMAPATAADVGRNAADFVFLRESLLAVPQALAVAREASKLVRQNLFLAVAYNAIAIPIAVLGYVTPLIAAVTMSLSSLLVIGNALRLGRHAASGLAPASPALEPAGAPAIALR
jgi:Cu2+-exporting ATPase